jgi:hypothetical protein
MEEFLEVEDEIQETEGGMKWHPQSKPPLASGWYYVRIRRPRKLHGIRYFDSSQGGLWWLPIVDGMEPNPNFAEWLYIPGIAEHQGL